MRLLARFDARDHVRFGLVDQLIGQTFESVGERCGLCRLEFARLRRATGANQFNDARDDCDESLVVLAEPAE